MIRLLLVAVLLAVGLVAPAPVAGAAPAREPLPVGTDVDYQLGGAADVGDHVGIVVRDRAERPAAGRYNVCYVNGFQTQPNEKRFWLARRHLLLQKGGRLVVDAAWGEWLLDIRTPAKRRALARIVDRWTAGCAERGFDAVEFDNLDTFLRSRRLISRADGIAFARLLVRGAHRVGLSAGQKNLPGFDGTRIGYDFAVAEECARYDECGDYVASYGRRVLAIEYRARDFTRACRDWADELPIVLRDLDLTPGGVRRWC